MGKDKSLFSSHDKGSLSSFERYEHNDTIVSLGQLDGMWCKDPLIEVDLPVTKQSCSVFQPKGTNTQNLEAKSNHIDMILQKILLKKLYPKLFSYVVHLDLKFAKIEFHVQSDIYSQ